MKIEFIKDWKNCNKKGDTRDVSTHYGVALIEAGIAKAIAEPTRHKMIEKPKKEKRHYFVG